MVIKEFFFNPTMVLCALCVLARDGYSLALCAWLYAFIIKGGLSMDTMQAFVETLKISRKQNHRNLAVIPLLASDHGDPERPPEGLSFPGIRRKHPFPGAVCFRGYIIK
jgi:hypothetical protein